MVFQALISASSSILLLTIEGRWSVDFNAYSVREINLETEQVVQKIEVYVCRAKQRLTIKAILDTGYWVEYDLFFLEMAANLLSGRKHP